MIVEVYRSETLKRMFEEQFWLRVTKLKKEFFYLTNKLILLPVPRMIINSQDSGNVKYPKQIAGIFDIIEYPSSTIRCARAEYYRISRSI